MVPLSMTLSDLWSGFQGHDIFWSRISTASPTNIFCINHLMKHATITGRTACYKWTWKAERDGPIFSRQTKFRMVTRGNFYGVRNTPYPMGRGRSPNFWDLLASYVHDMMSNWILYDDLFGREENFTRSIAPPPPELARIFATQMLMPDLFAVFWLFRIYNKEFDKQRHHTASV